MQLKSKIGWILGILSTLSGILSLPDNLGRVISWLSAVVGVSMGLDIVPLILYVGISLFPIYLLVNIALRFRKKNAFEAEILDKKEFELGETVFTRVRFRGQLINGFFDNMIVAPIGKLLPDGKDHTWSPSPETLSDMDYKTLGNLHGNKEFESTWGWTIPLDYPTGEYTLFIRVYDHLGEENRLIIKEKKEIITIIPRSEKLEILEEESDLKQTKTEFLQALYFFLEHWGTYSELIRKKSLRPPQNGEIKWCSDQIKSAIAKARILNIDRINAIIPQVEEISNKMAMFGMDVLQQFPGHMAGKWSLDDNNTIQDLILRGNVIEEKLKLVIPKVELAFMR